MKLILTCFSLLWVCTGCNDSSPDSFRIIVRQVKFPTEGEFVRTTQKRILKELNVGRNSLITVNSWPNYKASTQRDYPPGQFWALWKPILIGSKEHEGVEVSRQVIEVLRGERGELEVGENKWVVTVGDSISEYTSDVTVRGPKTFFSPALKSNGLLEGEVWHGTSVMMITDPSSSTMQQVFITIEEADEIPLKSIEEADENQPLNSTLPENHSK